MGEYRITNYRLSRITKSIKDKMHVKDEKSLDEIQDILDGIIPMREMTMLSTDFHNGWRGIEVARIAESYVLARYALGKKFNYANTCIFDYHDPKNPVNPDFDGDSDDGNSNIDEDAEVMKYAYQDILEDSYNPDLISGYRIYGYPTKPPEKEKTLGFVCDCSTLLGLIFRGIDYFHSPYCIYENEKTWNPATAIDSMYGNNMFRQIDMQPEGMFKSIGKNGVSSLRTAADFAEFFEKNGLKIFDSDRDGSFSRMTFDLLEPGDIVFWRSGKRPERYRGVSHIAIVSNRKKYVVECTHGSKRNLPSAIYYRKLVLDDSGEEGHSVTNVIMVIRPNYGGLKEIPLNANILSYPWVFSRSGYSYNQHTYNNVGLEILDMNRISLRGVSIGTVNVTLNGSMDSEYNTLILSPGTYKLSGMENSPYTNNGVSLMLYDQYDTKLAEAYKGHDGEFVIDEDTPIYIRFHIGSSKQYDVDGIIITPTLEKIE